MYPIQISVNVLIYCTLAVCLTYPANERIFKNDQAYNIISSKLQSNPKLKRSLDCQYLELILENRPYNICILIRNDLVESVLPGKTPVFIYKENGNAVIANISSLQLKLVSGYVENLNRSSVDGYIENGAFYGRIILNKRAFYVEPLTDFPELIKKTQLSDEVEKSIVYKSSVAEIYLKNLMPLINAERGKGNICSTILIVDNSFMKLIGGGNDKVAIAIAVNSLSRADTVFRSTDFNNDGVPDNIGFRIKYVLIMKSSRNEIPFITPYTSAAINSKIFISRLSLLPNLRDVCLGIAFTAQPFEENVIGLSYTAMVNDFFTSGGFCMSSYRENYNLIAISYFHSNGKRLPQVICDISLTHEIGHSFGSTHDQAPQCEGYLMASKASNTLTKNTFTFSTCSKRLMSEVIKKRRGCLEFDTQPFCGNGILEENEECDCGSYYDCVYADHCCLPFDDSKGCTVNRAAGYKCHPIQGLCCTATCMIRDISYLGLSCNEFQNRCTESYQGSCGVNGKCFKNHCHNVECTRIGLTECVCPEKQTNNSCHTCCYQPSLNKCISSHEATGIEVQMKPELIKDLTDFYSLKIASKKIDMIKQFCQNERCVQLAFKMFQPNDYCLLYGELGVCNSKFECVVKLGKFPRLPQVLLAQNSNRSDSISFTFNILCFIFIIFF